MSSITSSTTVNIYGYSIRYNMPIFIMSLIIANLPKSIKPQDSYTYNATSTILKSIERPAFVTESKDLFEGITKNSVIGKIPGAHIKLGLLSTGLIECSYNAVINNEYDKLPKCITLGVLKTGIQSACELSMNAYPGVKAIFGSTSGAFCYAFARGVVKAGAELYYHGTISSETVIIETAKEFGSRQLENYLRFLDYFKDNFDPAVFYIGSIAEGMINIILDSVKKQNDGQLTFLNTGKSVVDAGQCIINSPFYAQEVILDYINLAGNDSNTTSSTIGEL